MQSQILMVNLLLALAIVSCSNENKVAAAFSGEDELGGGANVLFLLEQNYPNPFNGATVIRFQVAQPMLLRLSVVTEDWQEIRVPLNERLNAGVYQLIFNSMSLPNGDYYYVLEGLGQRQVRKMRIIK
jgi:hypothetical protein